MGRVFFKDVDKLLADFDGTEFGVYARDGYRLQVREVRLKMGAEPKTWQIQKRYTSTGATFGAVQSIHLQSVDALGVPAAVTDTDVVINGEDAALIELMPGEQIQIVTVGLLNPATARITYEELPNDPAPRLRDPHTTR